MAYSHKTLLLHNKGNIDFQLLISLLHTSSSARNIVLILDVLIPVHTCVNNVIVFYCVQVWDV